MFANLLLPERKVDFLFVCVCVRGDGFTTWSQVAAEVKLPGTGR